MSDYKQILTDLYARYNPQKIREVDELLARFPGRERELVLKVYMKYGGPTAHKDAMQKFMELELERGETVPLPRNSPEVPAENQTRPAPRKGARLWKRIVLLLLGLLLVSGLSYGGWYLAKHWAVVSG
ncbi:MAG TPA: hypothetical protein ENJ82_16685, partial [Bacteroidetes bacterium]|nr:hypothetical protein [Bacteroidota bacterium]